MIIKNQVENVINDKPIKESENLVFLVKNQNQTVKNYNKAIIEIKDDGSVNQINLIPNEQEKIANVKGEKNSLLKVEVYMGDDYTTHDEKLDQVNKRKTVFDIFKIPIPEQLMYDTRSFGRFYWDLLTSKHLIFSIFKDSVLKPRYLRIIRNATVISLIFCLNAMFYTDANIEKVAKMVRFHIILKFKRIHTWRLWWIAYRRVL